MALFVDIIRPTGYILCWGNMSYWGAMIIVDLIDSVPYVGYMLSVFIGDCF